MHHDKKRRLWLHEVATGRDTLLETSQARADSAYDEVAWAPDSQAFAMAAAAVGMEPVSQIVVYRAADRARFVVTSARYSSDAPVFSPDGKWLWFLSERHFAALNSEPWGDRNMGPFFDRRSRIYALALQPGNRFPFQTRDELEPPQPEVAEAPKAEAATAAESATARPGKAPATVPAMGAAQKTPAIVWRGLAQRLFEVPLAAGNFAQLATDGKRLWFLEADTTPEAKAALKSAPIDKTGAQPEVFAPDVRQFALSADGKKIMWRNWAAKGPGDIFIGDATPKAPAEAAKFQVQFADWRFPITPREEWRQLFVDAWRLHREFFYDRGMHGTDWTAVRRKYEALLPRVTDRLELTDLMGQMTAELSTLHSQVGGGDVRKGDEDMVPATLGAALSKAADGARIDRIYRTDPELVSEAPPLARAEVGPREGDVIVSVNGRAVAEVPDISVLLRDKAGKQMLLALRAADGNTRNVVVVPAPGDHAPALRRSDWEWERRRRVEEASQGRFGYLALRAMGTQDLATFARDFYPVIAREGLVPGDPSKSTEMRWWKAAGIELQSEKRSKRKRVAPAVAPKMLG